jgi:hypothetical protein
MPNTTFTASVALGDVQIAGLQCHADLDELPGALEDGRLSWDPSRHAEMVAFVNDASNGADEQAERERRQPADRREREAMALDRKMAKALADLASRINRRSSRT